MSINESDGTAEVKRINVILYEPGDANMDGVVNLLDTEIVCSNLLQGTEFEWTDGDFDGDGEVTPSDKTFVPEFPQPQGTVFRLE
jgi:hypothetical protein